MNRGTGDEAPLILTLRLDDSSQEALEDLRRKHFPPERNVVPAHLSLFQRLPGDKSGEILADIDEVSGDQEPLVLEATGLRFLGHGVAFDFESSGLRSLRSELARRWEPLLENQDRQGLRAHVTVQNKVSSERAKKLYQRLAAGFESFEAIGEGLMLWRYLGGPWEKFGEADFGEGLRR